MPRARSERNFGDDFEPLDGLKARCVVCPKAPAVSTRHMDEHRATSVHVRNKALPPNRLSVTSIRHQRYLVVQAAEKRAARAADTAPPPSPLSPRMSNDANGDGAQREYAPPVFASSQFDRDWDGMQGGADMAWNFDGPTEKERRMIENVQKAMRNAARVGDDRQFFPWPDRGTFLLSLVAFAPRSPLSRSVLELVLAFARAIHGYEVPTLSAFRRAAEKVRESGGGALQASVGSGGTTFFTKSIRNGLVMDMTNPSIRSRLQLYPRRGSEIRELRDAEAVAAERNRQPMAVLRTSSNGYEPVHLYLHEPLALKDGRAVLPELCFTDDADQLCGRGTVLRMRDGGDASAIVHVLPKQETNFAVKDVTTSSVLAERLRGRMLEGPDGSVMSTENPLRKLAKGKRIISVPLLVWEDDWRGTMGMGQYPHTSVLFSNALLDRTELDRRSAAVRFYATSAAAQPEELLEAFVEELNDLHAHPFWSWDCVEKDIVLVRPWMLAMLGDSVMLAKLSASIGVQGSRPCRICDWGGNQAFKHASDGIRAALQEGQLRTIEVIVEELGSQLDLAHDDDASGLMAHWTNTGIKDSATTEACTILLEENDKLKGKVARAPGQAANRLSDVEVQTKLGELRTALKAKQWYSPLLTITGFGGLEHTALDILHVASLGPGKYLAALTVDILGPAALDQLRVRLESLSTTAITDSEAYPAAAMIRRLKTLNGKQVKALAQLMPFALAPHCGDVEERNNLLGAWIAYGHFSRLVHVEYIADMFLYQVRERCGLVGQWPVALGSLKVPPAQPSFDRQGQLKASISHLWSAFAHFRPKWLTHKVKLHFLVHLGRQAELFGPLKNTSTERYESFNAVQRQAAVHTNRGAPSKDIASRIATQETVAHWASGGVGWASEDNQLAQPGPQIEPLLDDPTVKSLRSKWLSTEDDVQEPGA
ncbi:unnamed protein product [Tilletia caries]|nr:unnamed protein product [Tilletia caries]